MSGLTLVGRLGDGLHDGLGDVLGQLVDLGLGALLLRALGLEFGDVLGGLHGVVGLGRGVLGQGDGGEREEEDVLELHC